jgi:uncharacterized protein
VIAIMAKEPAVGRTKTRLCPPLTLAQAAMLYQAMLRDTVALVEGLGEAALALAVTPPQALECFRRISPPETILVPVAGADIGACLSQTLTCLLATGHPQALALNSDGPSLPAEYLSQALAQLEEADVVLGPSEDGGYYLIGLKRPRPALFEGIAWSTTQVTVQTLARAEALGLGVALLPAWYDVDTAEDLARLREEISVLPPETLAHTRRFFTELV